jgi:hypothetical protein
MTSSRVRSLAAVAALLASAAAPERADAAPVITIGDEAAFRLQLSARFQDATGVEVGAILAGRDGTVQSSGFDSVGENMYHPSLSQTQPIGTAFAPEEVNEGGVTLDIRAGSAPAGMNYNTYQVESNLSGDLDEGLMSGVLVAGDFEAGDFIQTTQFNGHAFGFGKFDHATIRIDDGNSSGPASWTFGVGADTSARLTGVLRFPNVLAPTIGVELVNLATDETLAYTESSQIGGDTWVSLALMDPVSGGVLYVGQGSYALLIGTPDAANTGHVLRNTGYLYDFAATNAGVFTQSEIGIEYTYRGDPDPDPVPEPAAASLALAGVAASLGRSRRRL